MDAGDSRLAISPQSPAIKNKLIVQNSKGDD